jgi:hypothetical protein
VDKLWDILTGIPWYAWIALIAVGGGVINSMLRGMHRHDERMAMIKQGMDPDSERTSI